MKNDMRALQNLRQNRVVVTCLLTAFLISIMIPANARAEDNESKRRGLMIMKDGPGELFSGSVMLNFTDNIKAKAQTHKPIVLVKLPSGKVTRLYQDEPVGKPQIIKKGSKTLLWVLLGVVVVGGGAAAAMGGGGSKDGGDGGTPPPPSNGTILIDVPWPE